MADKPQTDGWKEKYLDVLDEYERFEREAKEQYEQLRRAMLRISLSADGQDERLDKALELLREQLRTGRGNFNELLEEVDSAILSFDSAHKKINNDVIEALTETVKPLQQLPISRAVAKSLKHLVDDLPQKITAYQNFPEVLNALAQLQQQAIGELEIVPPAGLWGKLTGKTNINTVKVSELSVPESELATEQATISVEQSDEVGANEHGHYSSAQEAVAQIGTWLQALLLEIDVPEALVARHQAILQSLSEGMSMSNVLPLLGQVRQLVMDAYLAANQAFADYLTNVNAELSDIYSAVGGAVDHHAARQQTANAWQASMMAQVDDLAEGADTADNIDQLKSMVNSRIGNIRQALKDFQQQEGEQQLLATQLHELARKIKAMEVEAERNRSSLEKHRYKSLHDPLTELPNREAYNERIADEYRRFVRYQHPLSLAICDLDHFKNINDTFGHQAGDRVLKVISKTIAARLREVDFFGRYGGEEFIVIMPNTHAEEAFKTLEKIRAAISSTAFNYKNEPLKITLSMGVTEFAVGDSIDDVVTRADKALYQAKAAGRNQSALALKDVKS